MIIGILGAGCLVFAALLAVVMAFLSDVWAGIEALVGLGFALLILHGFIDG